jgi:hypothetical protein
MNNLKLDGEKVSDSVNLLVSMLVRYPEIGTLRFESSDSTLNLTFILTTVPTVEQFYSFKDYLEKSLQSFYYLSAYDNPYLKITMTPYDSITVIHIARDIDTLSKSEIALMIKILQLHFADHILSDKNEALIDEELRFQEEVIENMLINIQRSRVLNNLIGIRENGRVMVFDK